MVKSLHNYARVQCVQCLNIKCVFCGGLYIVSGDVENRLLLCVELIYTASADVKYVII